MSMHFSEKETSSSDNEMYALLRESIIEQCDHEEGEYISPTFLSKKKPMLHTESYCVLHYKTR